MADLYYYKPDSTHVVFSNADHQAETGTAGSIFRAYAYGPFSGCVVSTWNNEDVILPKNCVYLFSEISVQTDPNVMSKFDTSDVTNMAGLFRGAKLTNFNSIYNGDTSNVTTMAEMFRGCQSLVSLDLSSGKTPNLVSVGFMFADCVALKSAIFSGGDTSKVTTLDNMFADCTLLVSVDFGGGDVSKVSTASYMFDYDSNLEHIYVKANTNGAATVQSSITSNNMFRDCVKLPNYDPSTYNITKAYTDGDGLGYFSVIEYVYKAYLKENDSGGITQLYNKDSGSWQQAQIYLL